MEKKNSFRKILFHRIAFHIYLWGLIFIFIFLLIFKGAGDPFQFSVFFALSIVIFVSVPVYINFFLLEEFFINKKYFAYASRLLLTISIFAAGNYFYFSSFFNSKTNVLQWAANIVFAIIITTAIKIVKNGLREKLRYQEILAKQLETELNLLKSQINPHFLFNTLNNIYSLSLDKSDKVPETILKLSELMRYVFKSLDKKLVPLSREYQFMQTYIELERLRLNDPSCVKFAVSGVMDDLQIAPIILIPFVENSFKHGAGQSSNNFYLTVDLSINDTFLKFMLENNIPDSIKNKNQNSTRVGIANVRRRLELLYQAKHKLQIQEIDNKFKVYLELDLS